MPRGAQQSEQMRAESRKKILDTARQLFAERGYASVKVSDIANLAEMSQGNIYWYFASKKELFGAVLMDGFEALGTMMAEAIERPGAGLQKLGYFIDHFMVIMKDQDGDQFIRIVFNALAQGGVERFIEFGIPTRQIGSGYHTSLNVLFEQCQAEGSLMPDVEPDLLSTFFFSFINGLLLMYPEEWKDIPDEAIRAAIFRLFGTKT